MFERFRAAWRAFFLTTTAVSTTAIAAEPAKPERRISAAALWEAERHGTPTVLPELVIQRPTPPPGVLPDGMAMDDCGPPINQMAAYAAASMYSEGLGFLGYAYLAELSQRAEYRNVNSIWAEYCTKKWIKLTGADEKIKLIGQEFDRLGVRNLFNEMITLEGFFGRMQMFMDFGDFDEPEELKVPLLRKAGKIGKERPLKRLSLVEPLWSYPGAYDAQNPLNPGFYKPSSWYVSGRTVHASRMLTLVSNPVPNMLKPAYAFGGVSRAQQCKAYVDNWLRSRQSSSDLLHAFSVMVLATDMEGILAGSASTKDISDFYMRVDMFNKTRDNRGTFVIDKSTEEFSNVSAPISGVAELVAQALEQISAISGIPISILLGQTPNGLNASSDGEIRIFYDRILSWLDTNVRPLLIQLLDVVQLSLFGAIDQEINFEFEQLWEMDDTAAAAIRKSDADAHKSYIDSGVVDADEVREALQNDETGLYRGVDLTGAAPEPPEDDQEDEQGLPFSEDGWNESDHPRDDDGKFGAGGGGSSPSPEAIVQHVSKVLQSTGNGAPLHLGAASAANVDVVRHHTGYDLTGHSRTLEHSDVRHAMASHGNPQREAERGQVAIKKADFALIPQIVEQAHHVVLEGEAKSNKGQRLTYHANVGKHEYLYTESIRPNKRLVALKTMRKR